MTDPKGWFHLGSLHPGVRYDWPSEVPMVCTKRAMDPILLMAPLALTRPTIDVMVPRWAYQLCVDVSVSGGLGSASYLTLLLELVSAHPGLSLATLRALVGLAPGVAASRVKAHRQARSSVARMGHRP